MENKTESPIYWAHLAHEGWDMYIAATSAGLCYVGSPNQPFSQLAQWVQNRFAGRPLVQDEAELQPYIAELVEYLQGNRQCFTLPCDLRGTAFQVDVWDALRGIPFGQTRSYSEIAEQIRRPSAVRAVGAAIGANPVLITVPCHRVIGKNGTLTGYRGGMEMKMKLLQLENSGAPVAQR